jgi:hypothetical protein
VKAGSLQRFEDQSRGIPVALELHQFARGASGGLIVVYDGGVLSGEEVKEIVLADGELAGFAFVARDEVAGLVTPLLARRVASCLDAVASGAVAALENGSPAS